MSFNDTVYCKMGSRPFLWNAVPLSGEGGGSGGELHAALGTTTGQNLAAVGGGHSLAEAVLLGALALLGLVGTSHVGTLPFVIFNYLYSATARWAAVVGRVRQIQIIY